MRETTELTEPPRATADALRRSFASARPQPSEHLGQVRVEPVAMDGVPGVELD
jgi:hypothetical protein